MEECAELITERILKDRKELNGLLVLLKRIEFPISEDEQKVVESIHGLCRIFRHLWSTDLRQLSQRKKEQSEKVEEAVSRWIKENYGRYLQQLLELIQSSKVIRIEVAALNAYMDMMREQSRLNAFANDLLLRLCEKMLISVRPNSNLLDIFREYYIEKYADIRLFFYKDIVRLLDEKNDLLKNMQPADQKRFVLNLFTVMTSLKTPDWSTYDGSTLFVPEITKDGPASQVNGARRAYSDAWLRFLRLPLETVMYKRLLSSMHDTLVPTLSDPKLLHSFLTDAYNSGGTISLLALKGLFTLIHKHNLDYPEFYTKLYALFDGQVLNSPYRARFLELADLFLRSSHLPSYLVAAFVKRMARLALFASPAAILSILPIIHNLLQRHPACLTLLHRPLQDLTPNLEIQETQETGVIDGDPFIFAESDPAKCRALDSSLWELEALKDHHFHLVAALVNDFKKIIHPKKMAYTVSDFLNYTNDSILTEELERRIKSAPALQDDMFTSILGNENSLLISAWK